MGARPSWPHPERAEEAPHATRRRVETPGRPRSQEVTVNLFDVLEQGAKRFPLKNAIRFQYPGGTSVTSYSELHRLASLFSGMLFQAGVRRGDRVAVFLPNVPEYPVVTYGALRIGAVPVLLSSSLKDEKVREYVENCQAKVLVTSDELNAQTGLAGGCPSVQEVFVLKTAIPDESRENFPASFERRLPHHAELDPNAPALILYTSGTTGEQKGAVLSHGNVLSNIQATNHHTRITSDDLVMCFLPLFHCFGQNFVMSATFNAGATLVLHKRFELEEILDSLEKYKVTVFYSIPPNYRMLLGLPDISSFESVRYFFTAADTMPPETVEEWKEKYRRQIWEGWGLTETSPFTTYNHDTNYRLGSVGTAITNVEVRIAGDDGNWLPPGNVGEVAVRGPNVFQGYFNDPEATRRAIRNGWFYTGDIGRLDEDGYLYILDRKNDRIKVSGFSVWPREIEKFLREQFAGRLQDVGVIGMPDRERGEMPLAYVVARDPKLNESEIIQACRRKLTGYQQLQAVEFVKNIPKTPTGKILKGELRKWKPQA